MSGTTESVSRNDRLLEMCRNRQTAGMYYMYNFGRNIATMVKWAITQKMKINDQSVFYTIQITLYIFTTRLGFTEI